jgi:hypothetical protein
MVVRQISSGKIIIPLVSYALSVLIGIISTLWFGSLQAGFNQPDEPSHFLNSLFISDYIREGIGANPMRFALDYYLHYPKLGIGHWPPAYYAVLGTLFAIVRPSPSGAVILNILFSTLPVIFIAALVRRFVGATAAVLASVWYVCLPPVIWSFQFFLLDQPLTSAILLAAMAWVWFAEKPALGRALVLAVSCCLAVLVKGNGWQIGLLPIFHIALTGRWRLLLEKYTYVAAVLALVLVMPWYLMTTLIAADGFDYELGLAYTSLAIRSNFFWIITDFGILACILAAFGTARAWQTRQTNPDLWEGAAICLSMILAAFSFQAVVPAALNDRYLAPLFPSLIVLATLGLAEFHSWLAQRFRSKIAAPAMALVLLGCVYPVLFFVAAFQPKENLRLDAVADEVVAQGNPGIWLIDGTTSAEGAMIAETALRDRGRRIYVVRSSQLLATSDFLGRQYSLKYPTPSSAGEQLRELGVEGVVLVQSRGVSFEHSSQLRSALGLPNSGYAQIEKFEHLGAAGSTELYRATTPTEPNMQRLREINFPAKAAPMGAATATAP